MQTIDCTPTWAGLIPMLLTLLNPDNVQKGKKRETPAYVRGELKRMAAAAQHYHQQIIGKMDDTNYSMYIEMYMTIYLTSEQPDKVIQAHKDIAAIARIADEYVEHEKNAQVN